MENTFKSSVFGGFNRDDVIRYIEKTALESKQQIESLEQESDGLCRENAELRDKLAAAERERDHLAESYDTASGAQEALKKGLTAAQETITELRAQLEESAQRAAFAQKEHERLRAAQKAEHEREMQKLQAELETLRAQAEEYGRVKAHIADIELSARERADALDAATRAKLQAYIASCTSQCAQVLATLGSTCESVSTALRYADAAVSQLPGAFTTLEGQLDELKKFEQ